MSRLESIPVKILATIYSYYYFWTWPLASFRGISRFCNSSLKGKGKLERNLDCNSSNTYVANNLTANPVITNFYRSSRPDVFC